MTFFYISEDILFWEGFFFSSSRAEFLVFHINIAIHSQFTLRRIKILKWQHHSCICHPLNSNDIRGTDKLARDLLHHWAQVPQISEPLQLSVKNTKTWKGVLWSQLEKKWNMLSFIQYLWLNGSPTSNTVWTPNYLNLWTSLRHFLFYH